MIITCNTDKDVTDLQQQLESNHRLSEKITFNKLKPRMQKLIIFGAPNMEDEEEDDLTQKIENYSTEILAPALNRVLRSEKVEFRLLKILKSTKNTNSVNLIIELPQRDASLLEQTSIGIGFNRCGIKRYVITPRCFNCQLLGHMFHNCDRSELCAKCAGHHNTAKCTSKTKCCINCV